MKGSIPLSFGALLLGAAALAVSLDRSRPASTPGETGTVAPGPADASSPRLDALVEENQRLRERLVALEMRASAGESRRAPLEADRVTREEFEALRDELRAALEGAPAAALAGAPEAFEERVASTLIELRRQEAVEKVRGWQEERIEQLDETLPKIESWLELTPAQSDRMRSALLTQYDREAELTRRWEAGEDPEVLGEVKRQDREAHFEDLSRFLGQDQLERYSERALRGGK